MLDQDHVEAVKWFARAADQGHLESQFLLGQCCELGRGVQQDQVEAYKWYNLAAALGHAKAGEARDKLARFMNPQQITEGQRRATELYSALKAKLPAAKQTATKLRAVLARKTGRA